MTTLADPIDLDALRVRHEFLTLPDLHASVESIASLLGASQRHARLTLDALVAEGFLVRVPHEQYVRSLPGARR
jgi:Fic family protein